MVKKKGVILFLSVSRETHGAIRELAFKRRVSMAQVVREAINEHLKKSKQGE